MSVLFFVIGWLALGVVGAGFDYAWFRCQYNNHSRRSQIGESLVNALGGPIALVVCFMVCGLGEHGWWFFNRKDRQLAERAK